MIMPRVRHHFVSAASDRICPAASLRHIARGLEACGDSYCRIDVAQGDVARCWCWCGGASMTSHQMSRERLHRPTLSSSLLATIGIMLCGKDKDLQISGFPSSIDPSPLDADARVLLRLCCVAYESCISDSHKSRRSPTLRTSSP